MRQSLEEKTTLKKNGYPLMLDVGLVIYAYKTYMHWYKSTYENNTGFHWKNVT